MGKCFNFNCEDFNVDNMDKDCAFECAKSENCGYFVENAEEMDYDEDCSGIEFVWGMKSYDDLTSNDTGLYTMNDIELLRISDEDSQDYNKYLLSIETAYDFDGVDRPEKIKNMSEYLDTLLKAFEKYCLENNINTHYIPYMCFALPNNLGGVSNYMFDSIEEAFAIFKMFVKGYKSLFDWGC